MKCPSCGYNSFDYLESCKKCGSPLREDLNYKSSSRDIEAETGESPDHRSGSSSEQVYEELLDIPMKPASEKQHYIDKKSLVDNKTIPGYETEAGIESSELAEASKEREEEALAGSSTKYSSARTAPVEDVSYNEEDYPKVISDPFALDEAKEGHRRDDLKRSRENHGLETQVFSLAGFMRRGVAFIVDILIIYLLTFISVRSGFYFAGGLDTEIYGSDKAIIPLYSALFILSSTYFVFLHGLTSTTIGKMLMGIKLINNEGDDVGLWDSFVRWVSYYVSAAFLFIGFFWALFDRDYQTWHDKVAGTYVVRD